MKIGLLTDALDADLYGPGNYCYNLVSNLLQVDRENDYILIHSKKTNIDLHTRHREIITPPIKLVPRHIDILIRRELLRVRTLKKEGFDIVHELSDFVPATPFLFNFNCGKLVTIHDWGPFLFREKFEGLPTHYYRFILPKALKKADHIITISNATKADLINCLNIPEDKISTIYLGVNHDLFRPSKEKIYDFPYILHVGTEHPMKNLEVAFEAFCRIKKQAIFKDLRFVRVGSTLPKYRTRTTEQIQRLGLEREVVFANYVPKEDLPKIYSQALFLIFPSLYEGFGLPALEAMSCGTAVLASSAGSLSEIVGDAGITINPHDVDGFANAMYELLTNDSLRKGMVNKGLARAKLFSWEKTAKETLRLYGRIKSIV